MWELHDGRTQIGPLDEAHVIRMIATGLPEGTRARRAGETEWLDLGNWIAFSAALDGRRRARLGTGAASARNPYTWAGGGVIAGSLLLIAIAVAWSTRAKPVVTAEPIALQPAPPAPPPKVFKAAPTPVEKLDAATTLQAAVAAMRSSMVDKFNDSSPATVLLAIWAMGHLKWKDVAVPVDETGYGKVRKDVEAERGKRLCVTGLVIQIEASRFGQDAIFTGLMVNDAMSPYHFNAVKSTGSIVAQSGGRFCGVVTGLYDYSNSGGGEGHGIDMVGMFDLPENRK